MIYEAPTSDDARLLGSLRIVGLFAGIGGLELGLSQAGHRTLSAAELWPPARRVLDRWQPSLELLGDVTAIHNLPEHDVLAAGFPCTDLSPAGSTKGIAGPNSGLVAHVFRLARQSQPEWILLENVPNLLTLHSGAGIRTIVEELETLGYRWAYRVVDSRFTGVPQRRLRVLVLASRNRSPESVILGEDAGPPDASTLRSDAYGFYWTEGRGGLGWAQDAVPTLKGGSTIGINSAPAVWMPEAERGHRLVVPSIEDGERLQGFERGWTSAALADGERDQRWKLVGNAVTVGVAAWLGERLAAYPNLGPTLTGSEFTAKPTGGWPMAAFGEGGTMCAVVATPWPQRRSYQHLAEFIDIDHASPLSHRATLGFLRRLDQSNLRVDPAFARDVEDYARKTRASMPRRRPAKPNSGGETLPSESWASSPAARRRMLANRGRDTKPELALRRELHARGLRYRVQARPTPEIRNRMDIVFRPTKVVVDVRGCFWHACTEHASRPKANAEVWAAKLQRNVERDAALENSLREACWHLEVVWEHEDPTEAADRIEALIARRRVEAS